MTKRLTLMAVVAVAVSQIAATRKPQSSPFVVYRDHQTNYCPAGWMGDFGDLKINQRFKEKPPAGQQYSIQIKYSAERKQGAGWAGIYWQDPCNNWGDKKGGFDLTGFKKLKFKARGETGKEWVEKFMIGNITGQQEPGDSDAADTGQQQLGKDWKDYELDISGLDLSHIIGGFGFVVSSDSAPNGETIYIADVRYE